MAGKLERETGPMRDLEADPVRIRLGDNTYDVVPQRIGFLRSKLGVALGGLMDLDVTGSNIIEVLGDRAHAVLAVFVPDLMPAYEFAGYPTQEAMEKGEYDEKYDKSPSPPQIRTAFSVAASVNEIDLLKHLGNLIGPEVIRAYIANAVADSMTTSSESSSVTSGDTPSMTSGTSAPTSESTEG